MLELIRVKKSYTVSGQQGSQSVLDGVDLLVEAGQTLSIVGPSGCGKSTLLNIMGGLDRADSGMVFFEGKDIGEISDVELAHVRNTQVGFVFQLHHLLPQLTVLENVLLPTLACKDKPDKHQHAMELLDRVGLKEWRGHRPGELSGGQRQRVAVVRALINKPGLLLADEPTGSLDKEASENIAELLLDLNKSEGVAVVVVTHSMELAGRMGKVLTLDNGLLTDRGAAV